MPYEVEKARISDATEIQRLINDFAARGQMLARPLSEIYENIRDYYVVRQDGRVAACVALHINWEDLAEIKSLAVKDEFQKKGIGEKLVAACVKEAQEIGIPSVFCLTYTVPFFQKCGFSIVDKAQLPHKVWGECYSCPKFPNCDEQALIYRASQKG
jgi:amino-acid N-acetyltransferase